MSVVSFRTEFGMLLLCARRSTGSTVCKLVVFLVENYLKQGRNEITSTVQKVNDFLRKYVRIVTPLQRGDNQVVLFSEKLEIIGKQTTNLDTPKNQLLFKSFYFLSNRINI